MTAGKIKRTYVKKAMPEGMFNHDDEEIAHNPTSDEHPHFLTYAADLADALRHTIFVDQVSFIYLDTAYPS
jgi:hypothetical protein